MKFNKKKCILSILLVVAIKAAMDTLLLYYEIPIIQLHLNRIIGQLSLLFVLFCSFDRE